MSRSIGRPVTLGAISLRLLPWPAFHVDNFTVGEAPGFGAEPALRAPEVLVEPRLSSLWRGQFELSRVELTDASVNLVRNDAGRWNVSSVLLKASQAANAPTGQRTPGPAPRFPYIEATGTRINIKRGFEKLPYSLVSADFSMSLVRPDMWHIELQGVPLRTDLELFSSDAGTLSVEGDLHRASALGAIPVALRVSWKHASLGQVSRLLMGEDRGWRGELNASAQLTGEIDHLAVRTHFVAANLHRQEFTPERSFTVDATCRGLYSRATPGADTFGCHWPLGAGGLLLTGQAPSNVETGLLYRLDANRIPADVLASAVSLLREGAPDPNRFTGELSGSFAYDAHTRVWTGAATVPKLSMAGAGTGDTPFVLTGVRVSAGAPAATAASTPNSKPLQTRRRLRHGSLLLALSPTPARQPGRTPAFTVTADPVPMGVPDRPLTLSAELSASGYSLQANGWAAIPNLQAAAEAFGAVRFQGFSAVPDSSETPGVRLALTGAGAWLGGGGSATTGAVHLENIRWQPTALPFPVDLVSADAALSPGLLHWTVASATTGGEAGPFAFSGSAEIPVDCVGPDPCPTHFALSTPALNAAALQQAFTGGRPELLQDLIDRFNASRLTLPALTGTIHAGTFTLGKLPIRNVTAVLSTRKGAVPVIDIGSLSGSALGGSLHLQGTLSLAGDTPAYRLHAAFTGVSAEEAAKSWDESWGPGSLGGTVDLQLSGGTITDLLSSARGHFQGSWLEGAPAPPTFQFASWDGSGTIGSDGLAIGNSAFSGTPATVTGTIGWDRALDLQLLPAPGAASVSIAGTLAQPNVASAAPTE